MSSKSFRSILCFRKIAPPPRCLLRKCINTAKNHKVTVLTTKEACPFWDRLPAFRHQPVTVVSIVSIHCSKKGNAKPLQQLGSARRFGKRSIHLCFAQQRAFQNARCSISASQRASGGSHTNLQGKRNSSGIMSALPRPTATNSLSNPTPSPKSVTSGRRRCPPCPAKSLQRVIINQKNTFWKGCGARLSAATVHSTHLTLHTALELARPEAENSIRLVSIP